MTKRLKERLDAQYEMTQSYANGRMYIMPYKPKRKAISELELWAECEMLDRVLTNDLQ
jgi:hypothetical protein